MPMLIMPTDHEPTLDVVLGWMRRALRDLPVAVRLHATLVADELLTNARRHGRAPYVLRLDVHDDRRVLLISVDDSQPPCGAWQPGSGLVLVSGLSKWWGVEPRREAKTVWAELVFDHPVLDLDEPDQPMPRPRYRPRQDGRGTRP